MKQVKNVNLVQGSFSNNRAYSPIQQNQHQKGSLVRKNSALLSVRQSQSNRSACASVASQRAGIKCDQQQSNNTNNYATLLKQEEEEDFQFMHDPDNIQTIKDANNIMYQETFRTNNQQYNQNEQFLSNKAGSSYSTVRQSNQLLQKTPQEKEFNTNKENINNFNTQEQQMKKTNSAGCLGLKTKQKQYYSNASQTPSQQNYQSQATKEKGFRSEQNQRGGVVQSQNDHNKSKSRSPSYRKLASSQNQQNPAKSPSPISSKRQVLTEKSIQQSSTNTKANKQTKQLTSDKPNTNLNHNKSSNKSSVQTGAETPKIINKQSQAQFNLGYSPILKMDKGELFTNQGGDDDEYEGDENSDAFNFNKYSAKMANNIIENILDKDDIYEKTRQENKSYKVENNFLFANITEILKDKQTHITRLEQQVKMLQMQNQEMTQNQHLEKERYQQELIKFSDKIQRLKNIQTLYMEEKQNSENIEQNLNSKNKYIESQQSKFRQMVDWIFKTYSCLIVTKTTPHFEQDDLEYIWSQMTNIIRILSDDIIELQLENSLKQLLKQPLKLVKENNSNTQQPELQIMTNSSRVSQNGNNNNNHGNNNNNHNNNKQISSNLSSNNSKGNNTTFQNKDNISTWRENQQKDEVSRRLPFFATEPDESITEKTIQRSHQGAIVTKSQQFGHFKTDSNTDDTLFPNHSFERIMQGQGQQNSRMQIDVNEIEYVPEESENSQILTDLKVINESEQTLKNCIKKDPYGAISNEVQVKRQLVFESEAKDEGTYNDKDLYNEKDQKESYVVAVFDYVAQKDKDLSFKTGDKIQVVKKTKNGWWIGLLNKNIGYFPFNYVKEIKK